MEKRKTSKDKTAYLFKRYIWLLDIIFNAKKISFEDINNRWQNASLNYSCEELPLRTFHNHREAISQMFDIDILCDRKDGNKYFIEYEEDFEKCLKSIKNQLNYDENYKGEEIIKEIEKILK